MKRKNGAVQTQVGNLQMKIVAENKIVELKTQELLQEWEREKPIRVRGGAGPCCNSGCGETVGDFFIRGWGQQGHCTLCSRPSSS